MSLNCAKLSWAKILLKTSSSVPSFPSPENVTLVMSDGGPTAAPKLPEHFRHVVYDIKYIYNLYLRQQVPVHFPLLFRGTRDDHL